MKIGLRPIAKQGDGRNATDALLRVAPILRDRYGIELTACEDARVDCYWISAVNLATEHKILDDTGTPLIVENSTDGCQLMRRTQWWWDLPQLVAVAKSRVFRDLDRYRQKFPEFDTSLLELAPSSFPALSRMMPLYEEKLRQCFDYDIHFVGDTTKPDRWSEGKAVNRHRNQCVRAIEALSSRFSTRTGRQKNMLPRHTYLDELRRTRICVSPFGWGKACHRDSEAIACGAILVKPYSDDVLTYPDIYRAGETYQVCAEDFSDLEEVAGEVLDNWSRYLVIRDENSRWLKSSVNDGGIAAAFARIFFRRLGGQNGRGNLED